MKTDFCVFVYFILNVYHSRVRSACYMFCPYVFHSSKKETQEEWKQVKRLS